jgi:hypothetical protein
LNSATSLASINTGGPIGRNDASNPVGLYLRHAAKRPPDGNAELVPAYVRVARIEELGRDALALSAERPVAVEDDRATLVTLERSADLGDVGYVERHRDAGLGGHVLRARNVADRELLGRTHVEHHGTSVSEDSLKLFRRDFVVF